MIFVFATTYFLSLENKIKNFVTLSPLLLLNEENRQARETLMYKKTNKDTILEKALFAVEVKAWQVSFLQSQTDKVEPIDLLRSMYDLNENRVIDIEKVGDDERPKWILIIYNKIQESKDEKIPLRKVMDGEVIDFPIIDTQGVDIEAYIRRHDTDVTGFQKNKKDEL